MVVNINKINKFLAEKLNFVILRGFPRHSVRFAKKKFGRNPVTVVEIGTFEGYNAESILKNLNVKKMYIVDPYLEYEDYFTSEPEKTKLNLSVAQRKAKNRLKKYSNKIVWIRKTSDDALKDIPKNVDFIYVDGNHEYEYVKKDMENYYEKIGSKGILAGHDITSFPGVGEALVEFCSEKKIKPSITVTDWWVEKK